MPPTKDDLSGTQILGRYRVVKPLARGGMGVVYLARTEGAAGFTRPVVVKRIIPDLAGDETTANAFVREARILANLQHPGIVNVIDFDEEDGAYVMVLEYVHGYNLGQWHKYVVDTRKRFPIDYAIYCVTHVLDALHYAHTFTRNDGTPMQIVHRDVSPGNILVDTQGHVKLLDFGIARANEGGEYKTRDGMFKGKLAYSAPEVYDGKSASPRSDVYSTAVVLYQLLSGENPFRGKDVAEIVRRVISEKPAPIAAKREDISAELDEVLERALAKDPADRFPTAAAFADALRSARPRREEDFVTELVDDVWNDFHGDMPERLNLEPLQARDAAWRAATDGEGRSPLRSTPPPTEPPTDTLVEPQALPAASENPTQIDAPPATSAAPRVAAAPGAKTPWIAVVGAAVAVSAAGYTFFAGRKPAEPASRFVVVEKESREEPPPSAEPPPAAAAAEPAPSAEATPPPAPSSAPEKPTAALADPGEKAPRTVSAPDPATLSRAVSKQRGRIESCFLSHVKEVDGRPEVSVRFHLAATGHVESAELSPAALSATPLGQCLLQVMRSTDFGPLSEPVSFTIPITARRVK
ncbi:MAG TPA: protein kinase [Polyangiaceae bacterium]|nr:protein kinase [Polyangiaceae bacterium]